MKSSGRILTIILGAGLIAASWFLADRFFAAESVTAKRDRVVAELCEAQALAFRFPHAFGGNDPADTNRPLKGLVQESGRKRSIRIAFLSETEKEVGKGHRERQVSIRVVGAGHSNLVFFLADLEREGAGARVKELHLRPSKKATDVYQDAEVIFSRITTQMENKP